MNCGACKKLIKDEHGLQCAIAKCNKIFHSLCVGGNSLANESGTWTCPECRSTAKKGGDNSLTPVGSKKSRDNVTVRKKQMPVVSDELPMKEVKEDCSLSALVCSLKTEMSQMTELLAQSVSVIRSNDVRMAELSTQIEAFRNQLVQSEVANANMAAELKSYKNQLEILNTKMSYADLPKKISSAADLSQSQFSSSQSATTAAQIIRPSVSPPREADPIIHPQAIQLQDDNVATPKTQPQVSILRDINTTTPNIQPRVSSVREENLSTSTTQEQKKVKITAKHPREVAPTPQMPRLETRTMPQKSMLVGKPESAAKVTHCDVGNGTKPGREEPEPQQWTEVKRKSRRPASLFGTAGPAVTSLKAVELRKHLHLWNMESSAEEIRDYLRKLCPNGTCTVEELTPKGCYKSYKIGVPVADYEVCYSNDVWPINARINPWVPFKRSSGPRMSTQNNQPFRGSARAQ